MSRTDKQVHLRAALIAIGLYGAAALVWFIGPLLSVGGTAPLASERARGIAIVVVLAVFAAQALWRAQRGARRNRQLMDGLAAGAADDALAPGASEVALIGKRFADAVAVLREHRVGPRSAASFLRRRPFVYELPWYILIGAPGAGKTTTIVNSGLHFPLADAQGGARAVAGAGGTRHCDWWFTDEAVLIDTAGRYTTQDSYREADRAAWNGFLAQLVQHRPRQPINGVILTLSVTDLLQPSAERRATLARELRARIDELQQRLTIRFPIYLLVTKSDLLAGFSEFFADFDKDERAQVWGTTLPLEAGADAAARLALLTGELNALEKTLNEQLYDRLRDERDRERRAAIFTFPRQWRLLREALVEMLQATFPATADGGNALLRGVYFTSATQEGSPVDRALGGLARAMGLAHRVLPAARGSGRSYFVTRLLREVIIDEAGVAGTNRLWERRRAGLHAITVAASLLLALGVTAFAWQRESAARTWLTDAAREVQAVRTNATTVRASASGELAPLVPLLDAVAAFAQRTRTDAAAEPAWVTLGLEARAPLAAVSQDVYHHLLRETLLPRIASRLEGRLAVRGAEQVDTLYEALKAYLMLFGGRHVDAAALRGYLLAERDGALPPAYRGPLRVHIERLLATGEVGAPSQADAALVAQVRERVAAVPLAERVVQRLRQSGPGEAAAAPGLDQLAGPAASKVLQRASGTPLAEPLRLGLAGRAEDLRAQVQQALRQFELEAPWVLAGTKWPAPDDGARAQLIEQVRARHGAELRQGWLEVLADLRLQAAPTLTSLAEQAQVLSRPDSPLLMLVQAMLRDVGPQAAGEPIASLRSYASGEPAGWVSLHSALGRVATQLVAIDDALARQLPPPGTDALLELSQGVAQLPEPLRPLLQSLSTQAVGRSLNAMREPLNRQLAADVLPACTGATQDQYPFVRNATQQVSHEAFARAFAPGGALDAFQQRQLAGLMGLARAPAARAPTARDGDAATPPTLAADALQAFSRAQAIRQAFFADGARMPKVRLQLRLLEMDAGIGAFVIEVDGQTLRFTRDNRTAQLLQWPGAAGGRITLQAPAPGASAGTGYSFDGPWALLKLFERVRVEPGAGAAVATAVFDIEGRRARFELRGAAGAPLPFALELDRFQCPRRL
jgi:type VI secretion system protein ImpL